MKSEKLSFPGSQGHRLMARLDRPASGDIRAFTMFAHCFTCSKNLKPILNINQTLTAAGFAVLRFDFTGLGESEGEFADTNFTSNVEDLLLAARFLAGEHAAPQLLIGHSLGGSAVIQAAGQLPACRAVVTIAAPFEPQHLNRVLHGKRVEIESAGQARVSIAGRPFTIKKQFLDDLDKQNLEHHIRNLGRALLIFHSPADSTVGVDNAAQIFRAARHPKSFISLDQADHLLLDEAYARYVGRLIAAWVDRYLE
ncbi:MAG: alpha/beta hydrolase [Acidobacteria bacterium]|nr:alpha/beta hydrolase [Acidobacteriota bacterium]